MKRSTKHEKKSLSREFRVNYIAPGYFCRIGTVLVHCIEVLIIEYGECFSHLRD